MDPDLPNLMRAYRAGEPGAQEALLEKLEGRIRAQVRRRIGREVRSERESRDVCQSLLLAFHLRAADGRIDFESEKALNAYLKVMVRGKVSDLLDHQRAAKRGGGKRPVPLVSATEDGGEIPVAGPDLAASMVARTRELHERLRGELTEEEMKILEGRLTGRTNQELAEALGKTPDAVRMVWNRARARLAELGILPG